METLFFRKGSYMKFTQALAIILITFNISATASAQDEASTTSGADEAALQRPKATDTASRKLVENYLTVTGGVAAHIELHNIVATGTIEEAGKTKTFTLIETQDGKRKLTYRWRLLGRDYEVIYAFDGILAWSQEILPKKKPVKTFGGADAKHFIHQRWFIQPFIVPLKASYEFKYQGSAKVGGRPAHVVVGYGKKDERTWFYFDKEKFLLTRWGGIGTVAGIEEYLDYRASRFATVNGVLLPKQIDLLVENSIFGTVTFDSIKANELIDTKTFYAAPSTTPVLRQRPVQQ
jgi:hypothetical protein